MRPQTNSNARVSRLLQSCFHISHLIALRIELTRLSQDPKVIFSKCMRMAIARALELSLTPACLDIFTKPGVATAYDLSLADLRAGIGLSGAIPRLPHDLQVFALQCAKKNDKDMLSYMSKLCITSAL